MIFSFECSAKCDTLFAFQPLHSMLKASIKLKNVGNCMSESIHIRENFHHWKTGWQLEFDLIKTKMLLLWLFSENNSFASQREFQKRNPNLMLMFGMHCKISATSKERGARSFCDVQGCCSQWLFLHEMLPLWFGCTFESLPCHPLSSFHCDKSSPESFFQNSNSFESSTKSSFSRMRSC